MDFSLKLFLSVALVAFVFNCVQHAEAGRRRLVGDPEMVAASETGMIKEFAFVMEERGRTQCPRSPNRRFRTVDGTCNNPRNEGATNTMLRRMVGPANYEDGVSKPQETGASGKPLPSPRTISETIHIDVPRTQSLTVLFMQFGQFIDHDVALSPLPTEGGRVITCCGPNNEGIVTPQPDECFPLRFPAGDKDFDGNCMEFVRSEPTEEDYGHNMTVREQLNALTSFVDASMVYGSEEEVARELRDEDGEGITLKTFDDPDQGPLLPKGPFANCRRPEPDDFCFLAGDIRVNEQPGLATIHTIFLRLHNVIARQLRENRPSRSKEFIFQTARKIVGGITQNILYGQWLPILLGQNTMNRLALRTGRRSQYMPSVDPSTLQEFSTAAYRMGHSLVPNALLAGPDSLLLREHFLLPRIVKERFEDIAQGLVNGTAEVVDRSRRRTDPNRARVLDQFVSGELTEHLFEVKPRRGFDLVSLNIQRGRDHGLRSYNDLRRECGFRPVTRFTDRSFNGSALSGIYESPDDIELFVGGLLERPFDGGLVGATFNCIIATQFFLLKHGDRFFFETIQRPEGFSNRQLSVIRDFTMAKVLCLTTEVNRIQVNAFRIPSRRNEVENCKELLQDIGEFTQF